MAKAKAKPGAKAKTGAGAAPKSWFWLQGVVCGGAAMALPGTALMVVVLLGPGLAMYASEKSPGHPVARAMLLMGVASAFMPLRHLWEQGGSLEAAMEVLSDPARPLLSWAAAGAGWLAGQVAEMTTRFALNAHATQTLKGLHQEREMLVAEWMDGVPP